MTVSKMNTTDRIKFEIELLWWKCPIIYSPVPRDLLVEKLETINVLYKLRLCLVHRKREFCLILAEALV